MLWFSPWIKPSFDTFGVPAELRAELVKIIIDRLAAVDEARSGPLYHFVDTRGRLQAQDWSNELHPTGEGFNKIAVPFFPYFAQHFDDWVASPGWLADLTGAPRPKKKAARRRKAAGKKRSARARAKKAAKAKRRKGAGKHTAKKAKPPTREAGKMRAKKTAKKKTKRRTM